MNSPIGRRKDKEANENRRELSSAIREFRLARNYSCQLADTHKRASEYLLKWSLGENNRAIKDLAFQLNELVCLWGDAQSELGTKVYDIMRQMDTIVDTYKGLKEARNNVVRCIQKERKLGKELKNSQRWRKGGEVRLREQKLKEANRERLLAEKHYIDAQSEQQAIKMVRFKECVGRVAQWHLRHAHSCRILFEAAGDVAAQSPDPAADVSVQRYDSSSPRYANDRVELARSELNALGVSSSSSLPSRFSCSPFFDSASPTSAAAASAPLSSPLNGGASTAPSRLLTPAATPYCAAAGARARGFDRNGAAGGFYEDGPPPPYNTTVVLPTQMALNAAAFCR